MEEPIVCKFKTYRVEGEVAILDWYDSIGTIRMNGFDVKSEEEIPTMINDAGFGAKDILAARLTIFKVYEYGAKVFWKHIELNLKEPNKKIPEKIEDMLWEEFK